MTVLRSILSARRRLPLQGLSQYLRRYFYSGWIFLMPYLFAYLLYYVTKWPVNPVAEAARSQEAGVSIQSNPATWVPCLLHVYWALHAIHVILASVALWSWWKTISKESGVRSQKAGDGRTDHLEIQNPKLRRETSSTSLRSPTSALRLPTSDLYPPTSGVRAPDSRILTPDSSRLTPFLLRLLPWLLLALIFYIPGVYLEWPSDPWEHLRRINEWRILDTVGAHSSWMKSAYFIPYSLLSWCIGLRQLFWLDFYYTGICLLLCWQYYRFSRACGLGERASMVFVILQALLFGNNIFSFYRYYGISSSIYAQLGAVALTRIVLEFAARGTDLEAEQGTITFGNSVTEAEELGHGGHGVSDSQKEVERGAHAKPRLISNTNLQKETKLTKAGDIPLAHNGGLGGLCVRALCSLWRTSETNHSGTSLWHLPSIFWLLTSGFCLLLLTAFNHPQGLGIAGLGIAAVCVWRLIEWKRSTLWWLIGGTLVVNVLFLCVYHRPAIIETYRAQGYLNAWYGFNILDLISPAGDRMLQIIGAFGLVNLAAMLFLLRRNLAIAWLTITPLSVLLLPAITVPLAQAVAKNGGIADIIMFQRMLFALPPALAFVYLGARLILQPTVERLTGERRRYPIYSISIIYISIASITVVPCSDSCYNHVWHANAVVPKDLQLQDIFLEYETVVKFRQFKTRESKIIATQAGTALICSYNFHLIGPDRSRKIGLPASTSIATALNFLGFDEIDRALSPVRTLKDDQKSITTAVLNLVAAPDAADPTAWIALGGYTARSVTTNTYLGTVSAALQNPIGLSGHVFTSALIPVQMLKSYWLEMTVRQDKTSESSTYLAVAWYDADAKLLESNIAQPQGAGNPRGWINGTYSYFGLVNENAPTSWTKYSIAFGLHERASIPIYARFVRIGALLNDSSTPSTIVQLTHVRFYEKETPVIGLAIPKPTSVYTPFSQAAQLSTHWPPQQGAVDRGGAREIQAAAAATPNDFSE